MAYAIYYMACMYVKHTRSRYTIHVVDTPYSGVTGLINDVFTYALILGDIIRCHSGTAHDRAKDNERAREQASAHTRIERERERDREREREKAAPCRYLHSFFVFENAAGLLYLSLFTYTCLFSHTHVSRTQLSALSQGLQSHTILSSSTIAFMIRLIHTCVFHVTHLFLIFFLGYPCRCD